ncbi:MAG: M56 family metallopeptidase [Pseudomonadota bacterium]
MLRPRVILPRDFERRFGTRQRRLMLVHEYTHLKRGDPFWNLAAAGFRCLFWFNPLVHIAATRFRQDQELACDATVLARRPGARRAYAAALLAQQDESPVPAFGFGAHPLKERIRMLTKLRRISPRRHRVGSSLAIALALAIASVAWAANPDSESASAAVEEQFAFDIEVTVDGRSQTGNLVLTGDAAISSVGGQPRMLASETLRLEHRDDESGWAAEVTISRMADEKFSVTSTIRKNDEVVATPRMIIGKDAPASIETRDPETGEAAYRLVLNPVDPVQPTAVASTNSNSVTLQFTVNGAVEMATDVELPPAPRDSMLISISRDREPEPWSASISLKRLAPDRLELCLESFHLQGVEHSIMDEKGCGIVDAEAASRAYMKGEFKDSGISWRLDMVPNVHE